MNNPTTMPYYHYFPFVGDMAEKEEPTFDPDLEGRPRRNLTKKKDLQRGASDDTEAKTQVFKWMGIALRGFRCKLANEYILPNANNLSSLKKPLLEYEGIRKEDWKSFVDKILSEAFQMEIDRRSPSKVTPKSVTNNPKATPKSVTNNNPKATPKSVTKVSPKLVTNDPTVCPKPDKNINTPPLPSPVQNPPLVVCEATSNITPRRSPRLTPSKRKVDGR
ncbi:hypothetical protein CUMW_172910, partial [Citrus unshiu]